MIGWRTLGVALAVLLLLRPAAAGPAADAEQAAPPALLTDAAAQAEVDRLLPLVGAARHAPFRGPLPARAIGREVARDQTAAVLSAAVTGSGLGIEEQIWKRLGLIAADADYAMLLADAAASAPEPRYDLMLKTVLVPDWIPLDRQRLPLMHAIALAIADRRFDLSRFLSGASVHASAAGGDARRARQAVADGDAALAVLTTVDPDGAFLGAGALAALAARLRDAIAAPDVPRLPRALAELANVDGLLFVAGVRARRPWSAVDALWADPPASSAEVLHPERYDACPDVARVGDDVFPALAGFGPPLGSDVVGEIGIRIWLAGALPPEIAARAAAGWLGDRAAVYAPAPGRDAGDAAPATAPLAWLTVWESAADADDFARAAALAFARAPGASRVPTSTSTPGAAPAVVEVGGAIDAALRRDDAVALLLGARAAALPRLGDMLDGWRRPSSFSPKRASRPRPAAPSRCRRRDRAAGSP